LAGQARRVGLAASVGAELGGATTVRFGDDSLAMAFELASFAVAALTRRAPPVLLVVWPPGVRPLAGLINLHSKRHREIDADNHRLSWRQGGEKRGS
jgi:hypothetical protein